MISSLFPVIYFHGRYIITKKSFCTVGNVVRVRFAPSPTGNLHLGSLRTALYNYLFARKNRGTFILRIEDTDQKRIKPGSVDNLQQILSWAGIIPDESPIAGGQYGPYVQSRRLEKYKEKAKELLETGQAYRCFCSETRLNIIRKEALKNHQNPSYDNKCRYLSPSEINEFMEKKQPFTIRFKLHKGPMTFNDIVFGSQTLDISGHEGDFIILKSDGFPTYHFACVVDDHYMAISHVLRGVEWLSSTTKHIMLHSAFNWEAPTFAHLPLLVNRDRSKLSKRQEALGVQYLKDKGYEPPAVLSFLAGIGSGFNLHNCCDVFELDDLCTKFNLSEVSRNSCFLDISKLDIYNHRCLVKRLANEKTSNELLKQFRALLSSKLGERYDTEAKKLSDEYVKRILNCYKDRISNLSQLVEPEMQYLWTFPDINEVQMGLQEFEIDSSDAIEVVEKTIQVLSEIPESEFKIEKLRVLFKDFSKRTKLKNVLFMRTLRIVLTGKKDGPSVAEIISMLAKQQSMEKLKAAINCLEAIKSVVVKQKSC